MLRPPQYFELTKFALQQCLIKELLYLWLILGVEMTIFFLQIIFSFLIFCPQRESLPLCSELYIITVHIDTAHCTTLRSLWKVPDSNLGSQCQQSGKLQMSHHIWFWTIWYWIHDTFRKGWKQKKNLEPFWKFNNKIVIYIKL